MQRDGAQRPEAGFFVVDVVGNRRGEVAGHDVHLGVVGDARARHRDPLADAKPAFEPGADRDHRAGSGIAEWQRLIQPRHDRAERGGDSVPPRLVHDLAHEIGPRAGLGRQRFAGERDDHALGAGRDQR